MIDTGFANGTSDEDADRLAEEATESALKLVKDLELFGEAKEHNLDN